jgi:uncharacterized protein YjiS (DUF1127 family)
MLSLFTLARRLAGIFRHRRDARILASLDAHMLADIGLDRSDLRDAFSQPLWRDPTHLLKLRAGERRARRLRPDRRLALAPDQTPLAFPPTQRPARLHL